MSTIVSSLPFIVLSEDQAKIVVGATGLVELRDSAGNPLGFANTVSADLPHGWTKDDIRLAKEAAASSEPRYTTQQVLEHLASLETR